MSAIRNLALRRIAIAVTFPFLFVAHFGWAAVMLLISLKRVAGYLVSSQISLVKTAGRQWKRIPSGPAPD